jgi:CDGSH-type Zn-finger protein
MVYSCYPRVGRSAMNDHGSAESALSPDGAMVTVYEDGPLIVRGQFAITAQDGRPIPAGRRTVALCRCGRSAIKPFCDGSHVRTGFRAPGDAQGAHAVEDRDGRRGTRQPSSRISNSASPS